MGWVLHLNKLESPSPKDALWQVWLKMAKWFWRRRFLDFVNVFSLFRNYLSLEKGGALHLNKLESPSPKDALCQVWLKLAQCFWRKRWKCEKFTDTQTDRQTDRRTDRRTDRQTTDDRWSEKLTWAFSSGELKKLRIITKVWQFFLRYLLNYGRADPGFSSSLRGTRFV